jgi:TolA-binding protein
MEIPSRSGAESTEIILSRLELQQLHGLPSIRTAAVLLCTVVSAATAVASGPWFESAPPTLPFYLDRLPAKSLSEIFDETTPAQHDPYDYVDYKERLGQIAKDVLNQDPRSLAAAVGDLATRARRDSAPDPGLSNLLYDIRDALASPNANQRELAEYITWRTKHVDWFGYNWNRSEQGQRRTRWDEPKVPDEAAAELDARLAKSSPALAPQWIYLRGALGFKSGEDTSSQAQFERVLKEFPKHPRAEAALFMDARCQLSRSRTGWADDSPEAKERAAKNRPRAKQLFEQYLKTYPQGAFAADAIGWLGAVAYDAGDYAAALPYYIKQTELPDHPELRRSALAMCEKVFAHVSTAPGDTALKQIAANPRLAMGLMYLIVNTTEANDFDGKYDEVETVKRWRASILPRLGAAVAADERTYAANSWQPRYLAILAHAASASGNSRDAIRLTSDSALAEKNDDFAFARAVALSRAHEHEKAIAAFREMLRRFPSSKLAKGARLRLAIALQDSHHAGEAVLELKRMLPDPRANDKSGGEDEVSAELPEGAPPVERSDAEPAQVQQLIDTLLNFAPLQELAAAVDGQQLNDEQRLTLTEPLAQRYLAREDFAQARKYVTPAQWSLLAEPVEKLTGAIANTSGERKATLAIQIGDAWEKARGKLLKLPLDSLTARAAIFKHDQNLAEKFRTENARALGFEVDDELGNREELQHAQRWWLAAADAAPQSTMAPKALHKALESMPQIAAASVFAEQQAAENHTAAKSHQLYDRLRRNYPDSKEAKRLAAYWNFPPVAPTKDLEYWDYDVERNDDRATLGYPRDDDGTLLDRDTSQPDESRWESIVAQIRSLESDITHKDVGSVRAKVDSLLRDARAIYDSGNEAIYLNLLQDLSLFFSEPRITDEKARVYIGLRLGWLRLAYSGWGDDYREEHPKSDPNVDRDAEWHGAVEKARANPLMDKLLDYLDFLEIAHAAHRRIWQPSEDFDKDGEPFTYPSRDYARLEKLTRDFLARYPQSKKREAASYLLAKAVCALSRPYLLVYGIDETGANVNDAFGAVSKTRAFQRGPFDPKRITAAIDSYDREFPKGLYAPETRNVRGYVAWRTRDWPQALDLTLAQLDDAKHPDVRPEAALRLASIFADLANVDCRADLIDAMRSRPASVQRLKAYLAKALIRRTHPLRYIGDYLGAQLRFKPEYEQPTSD